MNNIKSKDMSKKVIYGIFDDEEVLLDSIVFLFMLPTPLLLDAPHDVMLVLDASTGETTQSISPSSSGVYYCDIDSL
ncbi:hypothetical protein N9Y89_00160 [bacterium]|nr:hypothetical protein [bacterium]